LKEDPAFYFLRVIALHNSDEAPITGPVSYVTLRYGTGLRCLLQILSTSGDMHIMLFLYVY